MKYLIDSDYVADYLSARPQATELLTTLTKEGTTISLITFGEIYEGIYYAKSLHFLVKPPQAANKSNKVAG